MQRIYLALKILIKLLKKSQLFFCISVFLLNEWLCMDERELGAEVLAGIRQRGEWVVVVY